MAIRDMTKQPLANKGDRNGPGKYKGVFPYANEDGKPGKYQAIMDAAGNRGLDDLFLRTDCPCPAADCPHKGNCVACLNYHHMLSSVLGIRMVIPGCAYFSERDYWLEKRKSTKSPEVKEAIDEWLAYYRDIHNLRADMNKDSKFMDWDRKFEDEVNKRWAEAYLDKDGNPKPAKEREQRIVENKKVDQKVPGAYPYK